MILPDLLRHRAAEDPDAVALRVGDAEALAYGEWEARSNAAARGLVTWGIEPGNRVALVFGNEAWAGYAVCYLAVLKAGAVAVPLGSRFSGPELDAVLAHSGASCVVRAAGRLEADQPTEEFQVAVAPDDLAEILYTSGTTCLLYTSPSPRDS